MELVLLVIADAWQVMPDGRLNMLGAAPEWWNVPDLRQPTSIPVAIIVADEVTRLGEPWPIVVRFVGDEAGELFSGRFELHTEPRPTAPIAGALAHRPVTMNFMVPFQHVGGHRVEVLDSDDHLIGSVRFAVRLAPPG